MKVMLDTYTDENGAVRAAKAPTRAYPTDAGLDLYATHGGIVRAGQAATFHTGTHVQLPKGTAGILMPKSGMMVHNDLLTFGVVDEGYEGEVLVHIFNCGMTDYAVHAGDKVSQMLIVPVLYEPVEIVNKISGGDRGVSGFGSSGR